jgi:aryl-alcohol dehydrogenase-like predicted oxidoreductase
MQTVQFPDHPLKVSKLCLGTMMFGEKCDFFLSEKIV